MKTIEIKRNDITVTVNGNYKTFKDITKNELKKIFEVNPDFFNKVSENEKQFEYDSYISEILYKIGEKRNYIDYEISEYGRSYINLRNVNYFDIPKQLYYVSDGIKEAQNDYYVLPEEKTNYINKLAKIAYKYCYHAGYNDFITNTLHKCINNLLLEITTQFIKKLESYNDINYLVDYYYDIGDLNDDYIIDTDYNIYQIDIKKGV